MGEGKGRGRGLGKWRGGRTEAAGPSPGVCALLVSPSPPCSLAPARPWRQARPEHYFPLRCE